MSDPSPRGVLSWQPSPDDDLATQPPRRPRYGRSVGWAIVGWAVAAALVYVVSEVLRLPELGGWIALAGVIAGGWYGGTRGGLRGRREWVIFALTLSAILFLAIGLGSCVYAIALYG